MSSSDLLDSAKGKQLESGEATFTKVNDDVNVKPNVKLIGLTKEELEKYRNDPFWKVVRYVMFALFWLVWLAMFAGAILIVILSPKCNKVEAKCGDDLVSYRIFTPAFRDSDSDGVGDLAGIREKLGQLKSIGVSGVAPTPLFTTDVSYAPETVANLDAVDARLGGVEQLKALIDAAHDADLCFVADVPLAVSVRNAWALNVSGAFLEKKGPSGVLDVDNTAVAEKLGAVVKRLIELGADGLRFTTYGLTAQPNRFAALNDLIAKIRSEVTGDEKTKAKSVTIFVESALESVATAANYADAPLFNGDTALTDSQLAAKVDAAVTRGLGVVTANATDRPKPQWRVADVDAVRYDKALPLGLLQLILPGPVSVYYGEEIGLLPVPFTDPLQPAHRGAMRWNADSPTFGFSENESAVAFFANYTYNPIGVNFKDELAESNSQLAAFKGAAEVRRQAGAKVVVEKSGSVSYYGRIFDDAKEPIFVLAVRWPTGSVNAQPVAIELPAQFTDGRDLTKASVKAHSAGLSKLSAEVDLTKASVDQLKLAPADAVLLQLVAQ